LIEILTIAFAVVVVFVSCARYYMYEPQGRRFHTNAIVQGLKGIERAQKKAEICRGDAMRKVFAKFAENADQWSRAIR